MGPVPYQQQLSRRRALLGLGAGLGSLLAAPALVRAASLMPVSPDYLYFQVWSGVLFRAAASDYLPGEGAYRGIRLVRNIQRLALTPDNLRRAARSPAGGIVGYHPGGHYGAAGRHEYTGQTGAENFLRVTTALFVTAGVALADPEATHTSGGMVIMQTMDSSRRAVLLGLGAGLGCLLAAPAVVRAASLMPVRSGLVYFTDFSGEHWLAAPEWAVHQVPTIAHGFFGRPCASFAMVDARHVRRARSRVAADTGEEWGAALRPAMSSRPGYSYSTAVDSGPRAIYLLESDGRQTDALRRAVNRLSSTTWVVAQAHVGSPVPA